jgi:alginate O-acetyltransferase complex protein AlgI
MLFNSIEFLFFLPAVFLIYWCMARFGLRLQNFILLLSSYVFYACWDYRFLFLLIFSTLLDYFSGIKIHNSSNPLHKKIWLWTSILINLGFLMTFKYFNFFAQSFSEGLSVFGLKANFVTLKIILPVGISFYTFHGLSYIIDIYNNKIKPEKNFTTYSLFVSFFPLLVAGPIERATHLLPQLKSNRRFDYALAVDGMRQILWGLFKKIVIADNCAEYANQVFNHSFQFSGFAHILGAFFFAVQIYGDFSGYSDIAIGTAKLFGINLFRNFAYPYFSRSIAEFWRRWHISLSSWFKDYLYIPLGGSQGSIARKIRNTFIIFIVSGFWHGANWTFIAWGALNALFIMPSIFRGTNRQNLDIAAAGKQLPSLRELFAILLTFSLSVFAWIFFRSANISSAFAFISEIFKNPFRQVSETYPYSIIILVFLFFAIEWVGRSYPFSLSRMGYLKIKAARWAAYIVLICMMFMFKGNSQQFIYFQF